MKPLSGMYQPTAVERAAALIAAIMREQDAGQIERLDPRTARSGSGQLADRRVAPVSARGVAHAERPISQVV